jgi:hypothetical protein
MMISVNTCLFVVYFLSLSLLATAETVRGAQRELSPALSYEDSVNLRSAGDYVILTKTGISTVPSSVITGDIAVSPIDSVALTGFDKLVEEATFSKSDQVSGRCYAADYGGDTPAKLTSAVSDMETAYTDASGRTAAVAPKLNLGGGTLGGAIGGADAPLTPGIYTFGTVVTISLDITFDGSSTDVFIIQIAGDLIQAANKKVILKNGALAKNIFWQVAGYVDVGVGAHMEGIILGKTAVTFKTGSSLNGRILAQTRCNLDQATIAEV